MFCQASFDQWLTIIMQHLSPLSKPQATVLALWSFGMVLARSCALSAVSHLLATGMRRKEQTVRQQLREWYYDGPRKRGAKRQALRVETCFPLLLGWVVAGGTAPNWRWRSMPRRWEPGSSCWRSVWSIAGVPFRSPGSCCPPIPNHAWRREWLRLLRRLRPAIPRHWTVIVLADRGLYAPWLFRRIVNLGWHPFLRINTGGTFRPVSTPCFRPLKSFAPQPGTRWRGRGTAFQKAGRQVECTLLALWEDGYKDPWLILTDLPPEASDAAWYGLRAWIEQGFKITKRAGWQWHRTRMTAPERAARLWLAVAVATLWLLSVGGAADETIPASTLA